MNVHSSWVCFFPSLTDSSFWQWLANTGKDDQRGECTMEEARYLMHTQGPWSVWWSCTWAA
jgi:hypothetical protein